MDYCTEAEFREYLEGSNSTNLDEDLITTCITSASAEVDGICGRNFTTVVTVATARTFVAKSWTRLDVDDIGDSSGLIIETDDNNDGTFETTWVAAEYRLEPLNGQNHGLTGWPYTHIRATRTRSFTKGATAQVTAKWGWAAVPVPVKMATMILAREDYKSKDITGGTIGFGEFGAVTAKDNLRFWKPLVPYIKTGVLVA